MTKSLSIQFVEKSEAALIAAVEIYNKPSFCYREETFSLLMLNAWELLLKGKILADNGNDVKTIRVYEPRSNKDGSSSRKKYIRRNRSGNPITLGLQKCVVILNSKKPRLLSKNVESNLEALTEIRDNAAHFVMTTKVLMKVILEIATASVQNYIMLNKHWFSRDLSKSLSLMLPLSFIGGTAERAVISTSSSEENLINYLKKLGRSSAVESTSDHYHFAVRLDVKLQRTSIETASKIYVSNDPNAIPVTLSEEDIRAKYPWDYKELVKKLNNRYLDFKQNNKFHRLKKPLVQNLRYAKERFLDPGNKKSLKKVFYNSNIFLIFDKHYSKRWTICA